MFRRRSQNLAHFTALCVAWANAITPIGECDISIDADINDNLGLSRETVNVTRLMVLRIGDEQDIAETKRCHALHYNLSRLGYQSRKGDEIRCRKLNSVPGAKSPQMSC